MRREGIEGRESQERVLLLGGEVVMVDGREEERGEDAGGGEAMGEVEERIDVALSREGEEEHVRLPRLGS